MDKVAQGSRLWCRRPACSANAGWKPAPQFETEPLAKIGGLGFFFPPQLPAGGVDIPLARLADMGIHRLLAEDFLQAHHLFPLGPPEWQPLDLDGADVLAVGPHGPADRRQ